MLSNEQVRQNIENLRRVIDETCVSCGRSDRPVLLAATKTVPVEQINFAIRECGITDIGENRVQELLEKYPDLDKSVRLHFIGRLQKNKVKYIIDKVCLIHSADSLDLLREIDRRAEKAEKIMDVLLEINTGDEEQKGGFRFDEIDAALEEISAFSHVRVKGLMAVTPICAKNEDICRYFKETYQKSVDISGKKLHNIDMSILSMGMTDSMVPAILEGSTLVRIGSAIFGRRNADAEQHTDTDQTQETKN